MASDLESLEGRSDSRSLRSLLPIFENDSNVDGNSGPGSECGLASSVRAVFSRTVWI